MCAIEARLSATKGTIDSWEGWPQVPGSKGPLGATIIPAWKHGMVAVHLQPADPAGAMLLVTKARLRCRRMVMLKTM